LAVLGLGGLGDQVGLSASEVATALGYSPSNATNLLKRLEELQHLVRVPGERPARWRRLSAPDA
jgi:DNA-binding MarR family transcriptional regulator